MYNIAPAIFDGIHFDPYEINSTCANFYALIFVLGLVGARKEDSVLLKYY